MSFLFLVLHAEALGHLLVLEAESGDVRLHPLSVYHKLRYGALACVLDHFVRSARDGIDVDLRVRNLVLIEPTLGCAAVAAPGSGIDGKGHGSV